jgi:peroxiredoxin
MGSRIASTLLPLLVLLGVVWLLWPNPRPMPDVSFSLVDGKTLSNSDLRGKSVLLNFWSVSCEVCLRDMPRLSRLHDSLQDDNFMVLGVAVPHDPPPAVVSTVKDLAPSYPIALDVHGEIARSFGGIQVTPTSFLITPDGMIHSSERGPLDETRLRATLLTFQG